MRAQPEGSLDRQSLSAEQQARQNINLLRRRPFITLSPTDLTYLEHLLKQLDKAEAVAKANTARSVRSHIRAAWQQTIANDTKTTLKAFIPDSDQTELRSIQEKKFKLTHNLQQAVDHVPEAIEHLQEIVATYYADLIVAAHHTASDSQAKCKRETGLEPITHSKNGEIRSLDLVLVADLTQKGLNTGYLGIFTAAKRVTALLENLLKNNLLGKVAPNHDLLKSTPEGGYTKDQLELICGKLRAYLTAEQTRKANKA